MAHEARGPRARTHAGASLGAHRAEHELLRTDANTVAVTQLHHPGDAATIHHQTVARAHVFHGHVAGLNLQPSVLAGNQRILDGDVAGRTAADDGIARGEIDLLQQEAEAVTCHATGPWAQQGTLAPS